MSSVEVIKLAKDEWSVGVRLGQGGFASVYEAVASDGTIGVIKKIPKRRGAQREMLFESLEGAKNVIPILDTGETAGDYIIVMPKADFSLRDYLIDNNNQITQDEAIQILLDVAEALEGLIKNVVHRDIKPENVLLYNGKWCLADFGIARYAEATTAPDTRKYSLTEPYAAPEQWRLERATHATDVYAFGVMAFELFEGVRPFSGPDYRTQHLTGTPPRATKAPSPLASLLADCLLKGPATRPSATNVIKRLTSSKKQATPGVAALQQVNQRISEQQAVESARASAQRSIDEERAEMFESSKIIFSRITEEFIERVAEAAPSAKIGQQGGIQFVLGDARLNIHPVRQVRQDALKAYDWKAPFDVVAESTIQIEVPQNHHSYQGRAHSLWYCDAQIEGEYHWYELAFMYNPVYSRSSFVDPFALSAENKDAGVTLSPGISSHQVAWEPVAFDQGDEEQFIENWLNRFAAAVQGNLRHPTMMPEASGGRRRQSS